MTSPDLEARVQVSARELTLGPGLTLPANAVSRTFGILAVRGAGKSNTAAVMAEEMFAAGLPFVVIDPVGSWYGLRSSADGTEKGLPIPIFGGKHGDVPLERGGGELVADLVVDKRLTCVLDLSRFDSEGDKKAFLLAFARRLYQRNEDPLHLFLEEADDYIPQRPMRDEAQLLRAWENIVRRGRAKGLGLTLITQRSAAVAKMVLTQVETLFAMRTTGPQDIAAIEAWVKYHQTGTEVLASLSSLKDGEAWVWSPHYLQTMRRAQIRRRRTFDSGATPKNFRESETKRAATLADVDLAAIKGQMAATIEKAKADDPRELRKRIAGLERELTAKPPATVKRVEVPVLADETLRAARELVQALETSALALARYVDEIAGRLDKVARFNATTTTGAQIERALGLGTVGPSVAASAAPGRQSVRPDGIVLRRPAAIADSGEPLERGARRVLTAVAQYVDGVTREQLSVLTGYKKTSRDTYLQRLRARGFVEPSGELVIATAVGVAALGTFEALPTGDALQRYWLERLPEGERRILTMLVARYPRSATRDEIGDRLVYKKTSRDTYLQRLTAKKLVTVPRAGEVCASGILFD